MCSGHAYVEIYYRLILSTFLDYSFTHMALNIWNCIIRILACKTHQVKIHNLCINGEHSFMKLCQVDTLYIFAVFRNWDCSIRITFTLTHITSNSLREICVFYCWECMTCEFWIEAIGCCHGMHNGWNLGNTTPPLHTWISRLYCTW